MYLPIPTVAVTVQWDNGYFHNLFEYEYELVKGTGGAKQWAPKDGAAADVVPDAHDPSKKHAPMMFTTDLALRYDELYGQSDAPCGSSS